MAICAAARGHILQLKEEVIMGGNSFTEVTGQSWGSRLIEAIKGVLFGVVLFVASFVLLFWNEGRTVRTAKSLAEGASAVVSVSSDRVGPANEGKLVHMTGEATTTETLSDPAFGVSVPAIKLERRAEMYQWEETKKSQSKSKLGGGKETVTTYTYSQDWSPRLIDSSAFKEPKGHQNPPAMGAESQSWTAKKVTLGAFTLSDAQVSMLNKTETLTLNEKAATSFPAEVKARFKFNDGGYYMGADPSSPAVGDTRVTFQVVRPATVSLVGRQISDTFEAYQAKAGGSILLLNYGTVSADSMFKTAEESNQTLAWILRLVGYLMMAIGLFMIFRPFEIVADVLPILGTLVGVGAALFAGVTAACLTLLTIALSWLYFMPLLGVPLLILAAAGIAGLIHLGLKRKQQRLAARAATS
jgi:Transmembrane protein 43